MLILGGGATINALTGMHTILASFLIPISVIPYTMYGGLKATFLASYIHTSIIFVVLLMMIYTIYVSEFSSNQIWDMLKLTTSYSVDDCHNIFSRDFNGLTSPKYKAAMDCVKGATTCTEKSCLNTCAYPTDGDADVPYDAGSFLLKDLFLYDQGGEEIKDCLLYTSPSPRDS